MILQINNREYGVYSEIDVTFIEVPNVIEFINELAIKAESLGLKYTKELHFIHIYGLNSATYIELITTSNIDIDEYLNDL
jgi:hypothetical protein